MKFFFLFFALMGTQAFAYEALKNNLSVTKVIHSKYNQIATGYAKNQTCTTFKGTYEGNTVVLTPTAEGGSGRYRHLIVYTLSESYKTFEGVNTQHEYSVRPGKSFLLSLPPLKDDVPWLQQSVFLITHDLKTGESVTSQIIFNVTRPVVLSPTSDPYKQQQSCFQVFPPFESVAGILSNGSTNPSEILINQGVQNIWSRTRGNQFGFYFSPLAFFSLGNVFSVYKNYFTQYSKQSVETVEISSGHTLSPGDFIQLYEQRTRYVQVFDADLIDGCGNAQKLEGEYFVQWWGVAYHATPINPYDTERAPIETIGVRTMNTCPPELTPEFAREENSAYNFMRTF